MKLPNAPQVYDPRNETQTRLLIEQEDGKNLKQGKDIILIRERIVLVSPNGTQYAIVTDDAGVLSTVPYP